MAKFYTELNDGLRDFIARQKMFFTATAAAGGRVNLSPKGMDTFRCLDDRTVAYLDLTGSGNEAAAHLRADPRITVMFCSFDEKPLILRLYGRGRVVLPRHGEWQRLSGLFPGLSGARQIVVVDLDSLQTSCGFAVPVYEFKQERDTLSRWADKKGEEGLRRYREEHNVESIDGLPTGLLED